MRHGTLTVMPHESKDISTSSGGTFTLPAFGAAGIKQPHVIVSPVEQGLLNAARVHNAMHTDPAQHADVAALRTVYRRGTRSYKPKRHGASRRQWGMRRVRAHLSHLATGARPNAKYTRDDDLLPAGHPHAISTAAERKALIVFEGRPETPTDVTPVPIRDLARIAQDHKALLFDNLELKSAWDPNAHPRDKVGRFASLGADVDALIDGKQEHGTIIGVRGQSVKVRTESGVEKTVKAKDTTVTGHTGKFASFDEHTKAHADAGRHARQLVKGDHPEAPAWQSREAELGASLEGRAPETWPGSVEKNIPVSKLKVGDDYIDPSTGKSAGKVTAIKWGDGFTKDVSDTTPLGADRQVQVDGKIVRVVAPGGRVSRVSGEQALGARPDGSAWGSGYSPSDPRSDPAYDKYVTDLNQRITQAAEQTGTTKDIYQDPVTGEYSKERRALHDQILNKYLTQFSAIPKERRAVVLAGPSGSGKSSVIKSKGHEFGVESDARGEPTNFAKIDPDEIKKDLAAGGVPDAYRSQHGLGDGEMAALLHDESSDLAKQLRGMVVGHGTNILLDGTMSGDPAQQADKVRELKGAGYTAHGVLVNGDIPTSLTRAGLRHRNMGDGKGHADPTMGTPLPGRYVPLDHIAAQRPTGQFSDMLGAPHLSSSSENFERVAPMFDAGTRIYDNSGAAPKLQYAEEMNGASSPVPDGLDDERLGVLKAGITPGAADTSGTARIAYALSRSVQDDKPYSFQMPGGRIEVTPDGRVSVTASDGKRTEMPTADVEAIIDHHANTGGARP